MPAAKRQRSLPASPAGSPSGAHHRDDADLAQVKGDWQTENLRDLWEQGLLLDASIKTARGRTVRAHTVVLAAHSPYIRGLLTSGLAESSPSSGAEISLLDVEHGTMDAIVACLYTGKIALTPDNAAAVIKAANMLQLGEIEGAACSYLVERMQPESAIAALVFGEQLSVCGSHGAELHRQCMEYVCANFAECAQSAEFLCLGAEMLGQLIESDSLIADPDEGVVLSALRRWFEHEEQGRRGSLEALLPLVRFPQLPQAVILGLSEEPMLALHPNLGMRLLRECFLAFAESAAAASCPRLKRRAGTGREFEFESVRYDESDELGHFDKKGVLHHIATEGGTSEWVNPHTAGRVVASRSSAGFGLGTADRFVSGPDERPGPSYTDDIPNSWMQVDLGFTRALVVTHYALRSDAHGGYKLRNWQLQGAAGGEGPWTTLRQHDAVLYMTMSVDNTLRLDDDRSLAQQKRSVAAWAVEGVETAYRVFRILQHGVNSSGYNELTCGGIELYGRLTEA
jgi:hypothetical protein